MLVPLVALSFDYAGTRVSAADERTRVFRSDAGGLEAVERDASAERDARRVLERLGAVELACFEDIAPPEGCDADYVAAPRRRRALLLRLHRAGPRRLARARLARRGRRRGIRSASSSRSRPGTRASSRATRPRTGSASSSASRSTARGSISCRCCSTSRAPRRRRGPRRARRVLPADLGAPRERDPPRHRAHRPPAGAAARRGRALPGRPPRARLPRGARRGARRARRAVPRRRRAPGLDGPRGRDRARADARGSAPPGGRVPPRAPGDAAALPGRGRGVPPAAARARASAASWPTRWAWARRSRPSRTSASSRPRGASTRPCSSSRPTTLVGNWAREIAPLRAVAARRRPPRPRAARALARRRRRRTWWSRRIPWSCATRSASPSSRFHLVVLDEAQTIKNARSQARRALERVASRASRLPDGDAGGEPPGRALVDLRLARAGPPRRPALVPALLAAARSSSGATPSASRRCASSSPRTCSGASSATSPRELPPKTELSVPVELGREQRELYEAIRVAAHADVRRAIRAKGVAASAVAILDALTKLRQVCCDPRLVAMSAARGVARLGQARRAAGAAARAARGRAPRPRLLAVHEHAGARRARRCARATSGTSCSRARRATGSASSTRSRRAGPTSSSSASRPGARG